LTFSTSHQRSLVDLSPFIIDGVSIEAKSVKVLGVLIDCDLSMSSQVGSTISTCQLRRLKSIRRSLPFEAAATLVNSFVISSSCSDYCKGLLAVIICCHLHLGLYLLPFTSRPTFVLMFCAV
jgi:hypothetical protein